MGRNRKIYYNPSILAQKKIYYANLPEKAARHFLGQEYLNLGVGSQRYLSEVFGCSRDRIIKGTQEVCSPNFNPDYSTQRTAGGGRKKKSKVNQT